MILQHQHFDLMGKVVMERVIFNPPLKATDIMNDEACFIYPVKGRSTVYGGGDRYELKTDNGVFVKCGAFINHWHKTEDSSPSEAVAIHLYPEVLKRVYNNELPAYLKQTGREERGLILRVEAETAMKTFIQSLIFYFDNPAMVNEDLVILKIRELILLFYNLDSQSIRTILGDMFNPEAVEFREVIQKNVFEDLGLEDYAHLTGLSLSSFKRKFRETFGDSPARYIRLKRLARAAERIKFSNDRISDICYDCGYNDLGHFSKSFQAVYEISPTDYRKKYLNQTDQ